MQAQQALYEEQERLEGQERSEAQQKAYIPRGFAIFCTLYFYGATLLMISSIALISSVDGRQGLITLLPLLILAAPCLWLYGHWVRLARHHIPVYETTNNGVIDRASFPHGTVTLPYENIAQMKCIHWGGFSGLSFIIKDKQAFYQSLGKRHQFLARFNQLCYGSPFVLWQAWSDIPMTQLQHETEKNMKHTKHHSPFGL
jgi:hypothetical protein